MGQEPIEGGSSLTKEQKGMLRQEQGFQGSTDISSAQNSMEITRENRTKRSPAKGSVDISMRFDEPTGDTRELTRSQMKT